MTDKKITYLLLTTITLATLVAVYGLLRKGKAAPAVHMVMYGNAFNYQIEENFADEKFWDNYPYWVLLSRNKKIQADFQLENSVGKVITLDDILKSGDSLFFRYQHYGSNDSALSNILKLIANPNLNISIIVDKWSISQLANFSEYSKLKMHTYATDLMLPLRIEHSGLSYFFRVDEYLTAEDFFVPREAIPEITSKYLEFMVK